MTEKSQTIQTYNQSAQAFADKFDSLGARLSDIEETFVLINKDHPKVLEIGCGNGRDAEVICKNTTDYVGMDVSGKLIQLARKKVPRGRFEVADVETYTFQHGLDVVFAFASLIHTPKEILRNIFEEIFETLNPGGLFRLSMKFGNPSGEVTKDDEFGTRTYFLYSKEDIEDLGSKFKILKNELQELKGQIWLEILLQKSKE